MMDHAIEHTVDWLSTDGFMPHGHCYLWTPELLWTFVISESVIVLAYFSIPFGLLYIVGKRKDIHFNRLFKLFSAFIFACGTTHLLDIWTIWYPDYWLEAFVMAFTAIVSLVAAVLLWRLIPQALQLSSSVQMEAAIAQLQQEVAQRKQVETELEHLKSASDERFRVMFEQAAAGVAEVEAGTGYLLGINRKFSAMLGYAGSELLNADSQTLIHPDDLPAEQQNLLALREGHLREFTMELRCFRKDGTTIWMNLTVSPIGSPGTIPGSYIAIVQEITDRKRAEQALQQELDELQRWHATTLGRETRVLELKREVNELLVRAGEPPRYASVAEEGGHA